MKVLFLGAYSESPIVLAPIKVGKELFKNISSSDISSVFLCYFDDGNKYTRIQKLFGFEKIYDRVYRCGILPFILFTIKFKPDLIQIVTPDAYYLLLFLLKSILKYKVAYLSHSIISYNLKNFLQINCYQKLRLKTIEKVAYRYSDLLQMLAKTQARFVTNYLNVNQSNIRIVNNGITPLGYKKKYSEASKKIKIICIGSLSRKEKGFGFLFETLSKIEKPVSLSIYGYELQEKVEMKIPASVQLNLGKPSDEIELRKEICNHDFFIIPSKTDSFPLALLEAMETGILFISTNRVGLTERLPKPFKRFVIPYGNTENLKNKILELHNLDNAVKNNLAGEIREFTKEFTWEKISDQYIKLYTELLDR